jgi:hypothetical protein
MYNKWFNRQVVLILSLVFVASLFRLLPHPPNVTPLIAMSIFAGAFLQDKRLGFLIIFLSMFVSDIFIGFHSTMPAVYVSIFISILLGSLLQKRLGVLSVLVVTLASSIQFFLITNFAVWFLQSLYPKTMEGLILCYTAAIPFFRNALLGDIFYVGVLFGAYVLIARVFVSSSTPSSVRSN